MTDPTHGLVKKPLDDASRIVAANRYPERFGFAPPLRTIPHAEPRSRASSCRCTILAATSSRLRREARISLSDLRARVAALARCLPRAPSALRVRLRLRRDRRSSRQAAQRRSRLAARLGQSPSADEALSRRDHGVEGWASGSPRPRWQRPASRAPPARCVDPDPRPQRSTKHERDDTEPDAQQSAEPAAWRCSPAGSAASAHRRRNRARRRREPPPRAARRLVETELTEHT